MGRDAVTELQIAYLELASVGGLGVLLTVAGIAARILAKRASDSCTARTTGTVVKHRYAGEGRLYPIVQYEVGGKSYQARKKYNGVKLVQVAGLPIPMQPEAHEDEKGWLHVKLGPMANIGDLAEQLWPIGSVLPVHYNPVKPQCSYVDRPVSSNFVCTMFIITGLATIAMAVLVFFLIQL